MNFKKVIHYKKKKLTYYKGLLIRADLGLHEQINEILRNSLSKGARILDMGAGQGALSLRLKESGFNVVAADTNKDDFSVLGGDVEYMQLDFNDHAELKSFLEKNDGKFDAVCGVEVIEHVENPWEYVRGLYSLVKPGGLVLVTTPNITSWLSRFRFFIKGKFISFDESSLAYGHINPISAFELDLIMSRVGLKNVLVRPGGTLPPIYCTSFKMGLLSLFMLIFRPFQRGILNGWCIIATGEK